VVLLAAAGTVAGDHILYLVGTAGGEKVVSFYCNVSLGSARCVQDAHDSFRRFGGLTIVIGRFVAGVRLFAAALAGAGAITYPRFLVFDVLGALLWSTVFVLPGYVLGERATRFLERFGNVVLIVGLALVLASIALIAWRVWKRRRHRPATIPRRPVRASR
jgi:membrane-associated protein